MNASRSPSARTSVFHYSSKGFVMNETVLIVEDDSDIVEILSLYLCGSDYQVETAANGRLGLELLKSAFPSVVLVDLMMPEMNGFDFIKEARLVSDAPIVIISARSQPTDKMLGLDLGADGYITKAFDPIEVLAYVRAVLRRCNVLSAADAGDASLNHAVVRIGNIEFDKESLIVRKNGNVVPFTASELKIFSKLFSSPGRVYTKAQLYEQISSSSYGGGEDSIMVHVSNIRSKIEDDPNSPTHIVTVRGLGYRFEG